MARQKKKVNTSETLSMNIVKVDFNKTQQKEEYTLKNGLSITFTPIFPHGVLESLIEEWITKLKDAESKGIKISEKFAYDYSLFLCIKYFTHLGDEVSDVFEEQVQQMKMLVDTGYFKEIIEEVFMMEEIMKVHDKMVEIAGKVQAFENLTLKIQEEISKLDLKNAEMFKNLELKK